MIDTDHLCPKCMSNWNDPTLPCPSCGFHGVDDITGETWDDFTIEAGRYLKGAAIAQDEEGLIYIAIDLKEEKTVTLRYTANGFAIGEYSPQQIKSTPEKNRKLRRILLPILCAVILLVLCVFLAVHFNLFGSRNAKSADSELQHMLAIYGTVQDDGSIWLITNTESFSYNLSTNENNMLNSSEWIPRCSTSMSYIFAKSGETSITTNNDWNTDSNYTSTWEYTVDGALSRITQNYDGEVTVKEYDKRGDITYVTYSQDGETVREETITMEDGRLLRVEGNIIDPYSSENISLLTTYTYEDDGSYTVKTEETGDSETRLSTEQYDRNNNLICMDEISNDAEGYETHIRITTEYDSHGNIIRSFRETSCSDGSSDIYECNYTYEYSGDLVLKKICTYNDDRIEVTEHEYDEFGNQLTTYIYYSSLTQNYYQSPVFSCSTYEKYILQDGVYISTGETSGSLNAPLPSQHLPVIIPESDSYDDDDDSEDTYSSTGIFENLVSSEEDSYQLIELLDSYGFSGDSVEYCFVYEESELIWNSLKSGEIDYISDVAIHAAGDGAEYLVLLPPDNQINEDIFSSIICYDADVLFDLTKALYEHGYYDPDSDAYSFLNTFFESYYEDFKGTWHCGTDIYAQFIVFDQYMKLWSDYGGKNYELPYIPTGEIRSNS